MDPLKMFIPLTKADAAQRLVYGCFDETPDRSGEVFDYATSKPLIEVWSGEIAKASEGKSFGNVRAQHGRNAAGKLVDISFDDALLKVGFVAKIVDDDEWKKVEEGVYTGFSPGGRYAKRWQDGATKRYTADVRELSIVDVPCNPSATFTMIKADGVEEEREFVLAKAYEPGNEATLARAEEMAKAAGKPRKDYVGKARADLIAENAAAALEKVAGAAGEPDAADKLSEALAKAAKTLETATAAPDATPAPFRDLAKAATALDLLAKSGDALPLLAKGFYTLERVACQLSNFSGIASSVVYEEKGEGDMASALPKMAVEIVSKMRDFLIQMATDETAELLASIKAENPGFNLVIVDGAEMELAQQIVDMVKADTDLMEKAGARNSKTDAAKIQSMHDNAVALGATCEAAAEKDALAAAVADKDRLEKSVGAALPMIERLSGELEKMATERVTDRDALAKAQAQIDELMKRPEMAKGVIFAVDKQNDGIGVQAQPSLEDQINALPPGPVRAAAILASVGQSRR